MQIIMPKLGLTMTHGTITEWLKSPGDTVKAEEALCAYETEKVTLELAAPEDGILAEILAPAGATVPAGQPVCEFRPARELVSASFSSPVSPEASLSATPKARALAREQGISLSALQGSGPSGRIQAADVTSAVAPLAAPTAPMRVTPLARRMAADQGIDLASLRGSGPEGTVTREDVEQAMQAQALRAHTMKPQESPAPLSTAPTLPLPGEQIIPHSTLRRTIAERMSRSAFTAPQVTLTTEADAVNLVSARTQLNQELPPGEKISYNALLAALVAKALAEFPGLNARWEDDSIHLLPEINIALAVDTERGLLTPVLCSVDRLTLPAIQSGFSALAARALAGKSLPDEFAGGTFTLTNLGAADIDAFTPLVNPPQAAILGVGRIVEKPVARDGAVVIRAMMTLSLSFDHRIVDGGPAAKFLQRIKQLVERPMALLL